MEEKIKFPTCGEIGKFKKKYKMLLSSRFRNKNAKPLLKNFLFDIHWEISSKFRKTRKMFRYVFGATNRDK